MSLSRTLLALCLILLSARPAAAGWDDQPYDGGVLSFQVYRPKDDGRAYARAIAVVLHGCTQTARGFAERSGWTQVAEADNLLLLAPQFSNAFRNNCFNWMGDQDRPSRRQMVEEIRDAVTRLARAEGVERVFFTGLSAGGAMSAVLLAQSRSWEGLTVLGAGIVAGVVYGCTDVIDAEVMGAPGWDDTLAGLTCMADRTNGFGKSWDRLQSRFPAMIRQLGNQKKRAVTVSLWHGSADPRVDPINAVKASDQWAAALGLGAPRVPRKAAKDGIALPAEGRRAYDYETAVSKQARVDMFMLRGLDHRMPIDTKGRCGSLPAASEGDNHYDDGGICAARWIAKAMLAR